VNNTSDILFTAGTGVFTITSPGNYYVTWWVSTDGAGATTFVEFSIQINAAGDIPASSPIVTGQLNGSAMLTIAVVPATVTLINSTGETVGFGFTPTQANIIIAETLIA
jgi:hypothetical protein